MNIRSNLHTHTSFCDGANPPEETVQKALKLGFESIGFSGHSYTSYETGYCMDPGAALEYISEITRLKDKYKGKIDIYLGVENDHYCDEIDYPFDFIINAAHAIKKDGAFIIADHTEKIMAKNVERFFDGDYYEYTRAYFELAAENALLSKGHIIAHFDLVTKFNEGGRFFDETDKRYRDSAFLAVEKAVKSGKIFEINTGAMSRGLKKKPYPSELLLRHIFECGGEIIISSDCHDASFLDFGFETAVKAAKDCGFKYAKILRKQGFEDIML